MARNRTPRFMNLFSPERRSARTDRWRKRFRKFSLSSWHSSRIVETVCTVFRNGAEAARAVSAATGTQVVTAASGRSLRLEGLEDRQMLSTTPWSLGTQGNFSQDWSNPNLITANDNWDTVDSITGHLGNDLTTAMGADPQTVLGPASGTLDVMANQTNPNTQTTGGVGEFAGVVALQGSATADAPNLVIYVDSTGRDNVTISYNLRDIDGSIDNAVQPVALQYRIGGTGDFTNVASAFVADASTGPHLATATTPVSASLALWSNQSNLQFRIITTNAANNDEWIGIDDVTVTSISANAPPTAVSQNLTTDEDVALTGVLLATDENSDPLTYAVVDGPSHGTISGFDPDTGDYTYTPNSNYVGPDSFTFKANDGLADSDVATITINVAPSEVLSLQELIDLASPGDVIVVNPGTYAGIVVSQDITLDGSLGGVVFVGSSPVLTVTSGQVIMQNGITFNQSTDAETIRVESLGSLTLIDCIVNESNGFDNVAILVQNGGVLNLSSDDNTLNVVGAGSLLDWQDGSNIEIVGNALTQNGVPLASSFAVEDAIAHALDATGRGVVTFVDNELFVTANTLGVQRAVDVASSGNIVNLDAATFNESVSIAKDLSIVGQSDALSLIDAGGANTGVDVQSTYTVSIDGVKVSNFSSTGVKTQGDLTLTGSTVDGGLVGVWVDGGALDMQSTIVTNAVIFGVQVGAGGDADISTSEISGTGTTAAAIVVSDGHADIAQSKLNGNSRGLLVNATGTATVTGSDLTGNSIGGVVNATATVVNASGNWWGSNVETSVDNAAVGAVDFTPYLDNGTDTDSGRGFGGDFSYLHVTTLGAQSSGGRIQEGVDRIADGALTGANRVVDVHAGAYAGLVTVDESLILRGAQAGVDARTPRVGAESIIEASATSDALIEVTASNVTIDGFTVDGADLAFRDVRVNGVDNAVVQNNIITGAVRGVQYNGAAAGNTGGLVTQNLIQGLTPVAPADASYGVLAFDASYASVTDNVITSDVGVFEQYFYQPNAGDATNAISGNVFNAAQLGYGTNERASVASATALSGNTHNITDPGGVGVQLYNIYKSGGISLTNETITGADVGVYAFISGGSVSITGGSIVGTDAPGSIGVHVTNYLTAFGYAATGNGDVTIDSVDISDFGVGVHVEDDASGAFAVHATITNDTDITDSGTAILVNGADASADVTNNDDSIHGNNIGVEVIGGSATISNNDIHANLNFGVKINDADVTISTTTIHDNGVGIQVEGTSELDLIDGSVNDNVGNGLVVLGDGTFQSITVDGTSFSANSTGQPTSAGFGDITLFDFAGPAGTPSEASFTDVTINSLNPDYAIQVRGRNGDLSAGLALNPGSTAEVSFNNVDILGSQQRFGMLIQQYADLGGFSFADVTFDSVAQGGLVVFDAAGTLNLGTTTFHDTYTAGNGAADGTGFDIATSLNDVDATNVIFLDSSDVALDKTDLQDNFAIEDRVAHAVDASAPFPAVAGFVDWIAGGEDYDDAVFLTTESWIAPLSTTASVERAIDVADAEPGKDHVYIQAGDYVQNSQIVIDTNVKVTGDPAGKPVITPGQNFIGGNAGDAWILVDQGVTFDLNNVVLDGDGFFVWQALRSHGDTTVDSVDFRDIKGSLAGSPYRGVAIQSFGGTVSGVAGSDSHGSGAAASHLVVTNSTFEEIGRIGVLVKGTGATADVTGNTFTGKGAGDWLDYGIEVGAGAKVDVVGNTISGNLGVATDGSTSAGILVTTFFGAGSEAHLSGANAFTGNTVGVHIGFDAADSSEVTIDGGQFINNTARGIHAGGAGVELTVQNAVLTGNQVGIYVVDDALVDAGGGTLGSAGGNILTGYTGAAGNYAIENRNEDADGNVDVFATNNNFGSAVPSAIESVVYHTVDASILTQVFFTPAVGAPAPTTVYVNDDWAGTGLGVDPNLLYGFGNMFGADAFASIQDAIDAVGAGATIYVLNGTYDEAVLVNKAGLIIQSLDTPAEPIDPNAATEAIVTLTTGVSQALMNVQASGVTIDGFHFIVAQPFATAGVYMGSTTVNPYDDLTVKNNVFTITGPATAGAADAYIGFGTSSTAIAVRGQGTYPNSPTVTITNNQILPTLDLGGNATAMFDRAIFLREANGLVQGNTVYGDSHDLVAQFVGGGTGLVPAVLTVDDNDFLGKGGRDTRGAQVDFTEPDSHGSIVVTNNDFTPFAGTTPSGSSHVRSLMVKNNNSFASVLIDGNRFHSVSEVGLLLANATAATVTNNVFNAAAGDSDFVYLQVTNKVPTGGVVAANQLNATIQGNEFNEGTVAGGRAIEFLNHNSVGATFGSIVIGGAGALANEFESGLDAYLYLDGSTGLSTGSAQPFYSGPGAYSTTTMAPFALDLDAQQNLFGAPGSGELPSAMDLNELFDLEDKIVHGPDNTALGVVTVIPNSLYVTTPSSGITDETIQDAIDVANAGDTVNVEAGTFNEDVIITTAGVQLVGAGSGSTIIDYTGLTGHNNGGVYIGADDVELRGVTVTQTAGDSAPRYGVKVDFVDGVVIDDVAITNSFRSGLDLHGVTDVTVSNLSSQNNGGAGIFMTDVKGAALSNITTAGNPWTGVSIATSGQFAPLGTDDVVFSGVNSFGESSGANGGLQLEMFDFSTNTPSAISWSSNPADNANVTIQSTDLGYALSGSSFDGGANTHRYVRFYDTLVQAESAAAGSPDHIDAGLRYIQEADDSNGLPNSGGTQFYVFDNVGNTMSIQAAIDAAEASGDTINVQAGTFNESVVITKNVNLRGAGADVDPELRDLIGALAAETTVSVSGASDVAFHVVNGLTDVTINGFNVTGNDAALQGVNGSGHTGLKVLNNFVHDFVSIAVAIDTGVTGALVQYNEIFDSYAGVYLATGASAITVGDNYIHDSTSSEGDVILEGDNQNVTIRNNTLDSATAAGVYVFAAFGSNFTGTTIVDNAFLGAVGVNNTNSATLDADGNWWGSVYGPTSAANPWDGVQPTGASVLGNTTFTPWLTDGTDTAPNVSGFQPNLGDVTAPGATAIDLVTDSGNPTDNVTNDNTPTLAGVTEVGALVEVGVWVDTALNPGVVDDSEVTFVAADEADGSGAWAVTLALLADGTYQFVARVTDLAGNASGWSASLAVTIDSVMTPATTIDLPAIYDSTSTSTVPVGSNSDNITNINTPTLEGTAEAGSTVRIYRNAVLVGTVTATAGGAWSFAPGVLADGPHTFVAEATDLADNVSSSGPLTVTVDTIGLPSSTPDMTAGTDLGASNSDNVTNDNTPTFTGTAESGAFVELLLNGMTVLATGNALGGSWTITAGVAIPNGAHSITARVTDIAGNVSTSPALAITVDTVSPTADGGPDLEYVPSGVPLTITGTAADGLSGVVTAEWQFVSSTNGQVAPNSSNPLTFTPSGPGSYSFNFVVTDVAGNVTIDAVAITSTYTADFDLDGDVDGDDLGDWQTGFGTSPNATVGQGDEDRDGDVDGSDFLAWQRQLGSTVIATVAAVGNSAPTSSQSALGAEASAVSVDAVADSMETESSTLQTASWWLDSPSISHYRLESPARSRDSDAAFHDWSARYDGAASAAAVAVIDAEDESDEFAAIEDLYQDQDESEAFDNEFDEALLSWLEG